jgi:hypothetical protein
MHHTSRRNDDGGAADGVARDGRRAVADFLGRESLAVAA